MQTRDSSQQTPYFRILECLVNISEIALIGYGNSVGAVVIFSTS